MNAKIPRCICSISKQALKSPRFRIPRPTYTSMSSFHPTSFASSSTIRPFSSSSRQNQSPPSNTDSAVPIKQLTAGEYERAADEDMNTLHDNLEILCEDYLSGAEVEYSSGVMTLSTPSNGTYVINKQPPNQQIWISSPFSGPARFGYSPEGVWVHFRKEGVTLGNLLDGELKGLAEEWEGTGLR